MENEYINQVDLFGEIVRDAEYSHEFDGIAFYSIDLKIIKTDKKRTTAVVRCYFSSDQIANNIMESGMYLYVHGSLINSKTEGLLDISVIVDHYEFLDVLDETYKSNVSVSGVVTKMFTTKDNYKGFVNFVIAQQISETRKFSTRVVIWGHLAEYVFQKLHVGDSILVKGTLNNSTTKSRVEGHTDNDVLVSEVLGQYVNPIEILDNADNRESSPEEES